MPTPAEKAQMTADAKFEPSNVNVRTKISALWTALLFLYAYVDIFSLYRTDIRADLEVGQISGFTVNQSFLLGTTIYVVIPSLMVFAALVVKPRVNQPANIALSIIYALTIIAGAIGEWSYYILSSAIEVALLACIVYYAWTWPKLAPPASTSEAAPYHIQPTGP
jgi:membrane-anchored protein YejM (alkaline phosphatase superfamily)